MVFTNYIIQFWAIYEGEHHETAAKVEVSSRSML